MGVPRIDTGPMTVEEFYAFTDIRPDEEKWELIDGEPILNASPARLHQSIVLNVAAFLHAQTIERQLFWEVLPGLGVRVSETNLPVPDILVRPNSPPSGDPASRECDDIIVAFEVLSPSTSDRELRWKRNAYTSLPSLTHYVVIAQAVAEVAVYARDADFGEPRFSSRTDSIDIPHLGISLPLADIYRGTGLIE
jgi:Uma2 family endonuclease